MPSQFCNGLQLVVSRAYKPNNSINWANSCITPTKYHFHVRHVSKWWPILFHLVKRRIYRRFVVFWWRIRIQWRRRIRIQWQGHDKPWWKYCNTLTGVAKSNQIHSLLQEVHRKPSYGLCWGVCCILHQWKKKIIEKCKSPTFREELDVLQNDLDVSNFFWSGNKECRSKNDYTKEHLKEAGIGHLNT